MHNNLTEDNILVPARMLNEYIYCQRLAYIEWVQGDFSSNYEVAEGSFLHRNVDNEHGDLPKMLSDGDIIHSRSVMLSSQEEHLIARMDLVEAINGKVAVVEYKHGAAPDNPEHSWENDRVQLCAQGLVMKSNGYLCDEGIIYYAESKTRVSIIFDLDLMSKTRIAVSELINMAQKELIPPPLVDSAKCFRCSLAGICLPDETNMLSGRIQQDEENIRRIMPARIDAMPLYVQKQGARIGKIGELFEVRDKIEKLGESRIFETSHVSIFGNIQVSIQALKEMCVRGIPLALFSTGGWFYGLAHGMIHKNVELRIAQYATASNAEKSLSLAKSMIAAKIENCRTMLRRNHSDLPNHILEELKQYSESALASKSSESLLGIEGIAARTYYSLFSGMLKGGGEMEGWNFDFKGRNRRPPLDPVNAMLSYAYSLLTKDFTVTLLMVGFDPYLGFYHTLKYGRPSLALDLMEEFRPIIADSVVLWVINKKVLTPDDFIKRGPSVALTSDARKKFIIAYQKRLDSLVTHPIFGYRISYRRIFEVQARLFGRFLTSEIKEYPSFKTR